MSGWTDSWTNRPIIPPFKSIVNHLFRMFCVAECFSSQQEVLCYTGNNRLVVSGIISQTWRTFPALRSEVKPCCGVHFAHLRTENIREEQFQKIVFLRMCDYYQKPRMCTNKWGWNNCNKNAAVERRFSLSVIRVKASHLTPRGSRSGLLKWNKFSRSD